MPGVHFRVREVSFGKRGGVEVGKTEIFSPVLLNGAIFA